MGWRWFSPTPRGSAPSRASAIRREGSGAWPSWTVPTRAPSSRTRPANAPAAWWWDWKTRHALEPKLPPSIGQQVSGPLRVRGEIAVVSADGPPTRSGTGWCSAAAAPRQVLRRQPRVHRVPGRVLTQGRTRYPHAGVRRGVRYMPGDTRDCPCLHVPARGRQV